MKYPDTSKYYLGEYIDDRGYQSPEVYKKSEFYTSNKVIQEIFSTMTVKVKTESGEIVRKRYHSNIDPYEGYYLYELIKLNNFRKVLILGMRYGMSALYTCQAFSELPKQGKKCELVCVDENQALEWENVGLTNLQEAGLNNYCEIIYEYAQTALPKILEDITKGKREGFDVIFINGMLLFDYTINNVFNSDFLLNIGGCMGILDIRLPSVKEATLYIDKNYKHFKNLKLLNPSKTVTWYEKIGEDKREWYEHTNICENRLVPF